MIRVSLSPEPSEADFSPTSSASSGDGFAESAVLPQRQDADGAENNTADGNEVNVAKESQDQQQPAPRGGKAKGKLGKTKSGDKGGKGRGGKTKKHVPQKRPAVVMREASECLRRKEAA